MGNGDGEGLLQVLLRQEGRGRRRPAGRAAVAQGRSRLAGRAAASQGRGHLRHLRRRLGLPSDEVSQDTSGVLQGSIKLKVRGDHVICVGSTVACLAKTVHQLEEINVGQKR